ncbi:MAG: ABC transporter substrate-binding protein, partial [Candidatus Pacearchaeota archaeon]|nr:ABC transporter substrate-binding protein [Candidatus Pacearchaeota archaeon]
MNIGLSEITKRAVEQLPSSAQWMRLPQVLSRREGRTLVVLTLFFAASFFALALSFYLKNTESVPAAGGRIIEGVAGSPRFLNPVYADTSDADRDLVNVLFSGLLSSDREGKLTPDLAEEFIVGDGGRSVEIRLRDNIYWHDGVPITADDVVFTIKVLSDASYKSPVRANWVGVTAEKLSERVVLFKLQEPYAGFFERLTVKIIPQHIWENIAPENFALSSYNLQAVGSGPYKIEKISQDSSGAVSEIRLKANLNYHKHAPYIQSLIFRFYANEEELAGAVRRGQVTSFAISSPDLAEPTERSNLQRLSLRLPRYFALFFNLREQPLSNKKIREALAYATNSEELVNTLFETYAREVNSPMLPDVFALKDPGISYDYDPALA